MSSLIRISIQIRYITCISCWIFNNILGSNLQKYGSDQQWDWQYQWETHQAKTGAWEAQEWGGGTEQVQRGEPGQCGQGAEEAQRREEHHQQWHWDDQVGYEKLLDVI